MIKELQSFITKISLVLVVVLGISLLSWSYLNWRQAQNIINPDRSISFSATGQVFAKPDIAKLNFSVITQGKEAEVVQTENNTKTQKVIDFIKSSGVQPEDIQTINYSLNPQYDYSWCRQPKEDQFISCPPKIIGYELTQTVAVKIRDFDKINTIIGGLSEHGVNQISNISFEIDDEEVYKNQARIKALNIIEKRAKLISSQTDIKLGRILNVTESSNDSRYKNYLTQPVMAPTAEVVSSAPIETGTNEINVTLTVTYEIK
jgi:hypothetical protein